MQKSTTPELEDSLPAINESNPKFLDSFRTVKPSDFEINISGFTGTKSMISVPKEKIQKTLTFQAKRDSKQQDSENNAENNDIIMEKKRASFNYMKKWDDYCKQTNGIYRNMIEKIMIFLLEIGGSALESYASLLKFLKDKSIQEKSFSNNQNNEAVIWDKFKECEISRSYQEIAYQEDLQRKEHLQFANFIEIDLIQKVLSPNQTKYQSLFDHYKKFELKMRQNLNKMLVIARDKFEEYATAFSEVMRSYLVNKQISTKDLLTFENLYLYAISENYNLLKSYSREMKEFWFGLKKIEMERLKVFGSIVSQFIEKEEKLFQFFPFYQDSITIIRNKLQNINPEKHIEALFEMSKILSSEQMQYLRQKHKLENYSEDVIFDYLEAFQIKPLNFRPLILGDFRCFEKDENSQKYIKNSSSLWKEIKLMISLDLNMMVLTDGGDSSFKPVKIIRLPLTTCIYNEEICMATFSEIKSTVLTMNNVEKYVFKLKGSQEFNEFKDLVNKYIRKL